MIWGLKTKELVLILFPILMGMVILGGAALMKMDRGEEVGRSLEGGVFVGGKKVNGGRPEGEM